MTTNQSRVFALANVLKKERNITQKEAFAIAMIVYNPESKEGVAPEQAAIGESLVAALQKGAVRFTFINQLGQMITTNGTMLQSRIPNPTRRIAGRRTPTHPNNVVFFDITHGQYRQFDPNRVVRIINGNVKRGRKRKTAIQKVVVTTPVKNKEPESAAV